MQRKYNGLRLIALLSVAISGTATAQQATPAEQTPQANPVPAPPSAIPDATTPGPTGRRAGEEGIVVTGSRVRRKDLTTPAPVSVISRDPTTANGVASIG